MDFIRDVAFPLPAMVIAGLMGAPAEDLDAIKTWSDRLAAYLGGAVDARDNFTEASAGVGALVDYFGGLLREHERRPQDDLMTLPPRRARGRPSDARRGRRERRSPMFAGHETTTNLIGNGLFHLLRNPRRRT
jgi:cytochrome P450